jgi:hypothetical protein
MPRAQQHQQQQHQRAHRSSSGSEAMRAGSSSSGSSHQQQSLAGSSSGIEAQRLLAALAAERAASGAPVPYSLIPSRSLSNASSRVRSKQRAHDPSAVLSDQDEPRRSHRSRTSRDRRRHGDEAAGAASDDSASTQGSGAVGGEASGSSSRQSAPGSPARRPRAGTLVARSPPNAVSAESLAASAGALTPTLLRTARSAFFTTAGSSPQLCALNATASRESSPAPSSRAPAPPRVRPSASAPGKESAIRLAPALPSLAAVSRGRSANVSPSRLGRRGASASVLSGAEDSSGDGDGGADSERTAHADGTVRLAGHLPATRTSRASSILSRPPSRTSIDLDGALFSDDEGERHALSSSSLSDSEELGASSHSSRNHSRRSSIASRERRRGLRVLLRPVSGSAKAHSAASEEPASCATSLGTATTSASTSSDHDGMSGTSVVSSRSSSCEHTLEFRARRRQRSKEDAVLIDVLPREDTTPAAETHEADDEGEGLDMRSASVPASALLIRRRSRSTRRAALASRSPPPSRAAQKLARLVGGEAALQPARRDLSISISPPAGALARSAGSSGSAASGTQPALRIELEPEADPLLCPTQGGIADLVAVPAVEWDSESERRRRSSGSSGLSGNRLRQTRGAYASPEGTEHEAARRSGFAAAYQERITAIGSHLRLWSRSTAADDASVAAATPASPPRTEPAAPQSAAAFVPPPAMEPMVPSASAAPVAVSTHADESLFSASWRRLARLPNLILLPALTARAPAVAHDAQGPTSPKRVDAHEAATHLGLPPSPTVLPIGLPSSPTTPNSPGRSPLSRCSSDSGDSQSRRSSTVEHIKEARGVVSPLDGDRDTGAYVSGLGAPIDPDTELSSVMHLQTFRSTRSRSASRGPVNEHAAPAGDDRRSSADEGAAGKFDLAGRSAARRRGSEPLLPKSLAQPLPASRGRMRVRDFLELPPNLVESTVSAPTSPELRSSSLSRSPSKERLEPRSDEEARSTDDLTDDEMTPAAPASERARRQSDDEDSDGFRKVRRGRRGRCSPSGAAPRCSRPAVQEPVPETFSAYGSSLSGSGSASEEEVPRNARRPRGSASREREAASSRSSGRESRGRAGRAGRTSSPSTTATPRQNAIGLFSSSPGTRRRSNRGGDSQHSAVSLPRVRSSPNLSYAAAPAHAAQHLRQAAAAAAVPPPAPLENALLPPVGAVDPNSSSDDESSDTRGRAGEVKVVSVSVEAAAAPLVAPQARTARTSSLGRSRLTRGPAPPPHVLVNGGAPGRAASAPLPSRPCMVSNGAHLLMLSCEMSMMRASKISGSLKPRWLKARVRQVRVWDLNETPEEAPPGMGGATLFRPRAGSSLRHEVLQS